MKWLKGLFGSKQEKQGNVDTDDPIAMAEAMLAETEQILQDGDSLIGQLNDLDSDEIARVEWFTGLPEDHKQRSHQRPGPVLSLFRLRSGSVVLFDYRSGFDRSGGILQPGSDIVGGRIGTGHFAVRRADDVHRTARTPHVFRT